MLGDVRVVVDTNVFVSGVFFGGAPRDVLSAWRDDVIDVLEAGARLRRFTTLLQPSQAATAATGSDSRPRSTMPRRNAGRSVSSRNDE